MPGPNLLTEKESRFETGLENWALASPFVPFDTTMTLMTDGGHTGSNYLRFQTLSGDGVQSPGGVLSHSVPVDGSALYVVSAWVRPSRDMRLTWRAIGRDNSETIVAILAAQPAITQPAGVWTYIRSNVGNSISPATHISPFSVGMVDSSGSLPGDTFDLDDLFFGLETAPILASLPDAAFTAEVRSEARLIPGIRMDGG